MHCWWHCKPAQRFLKTLKTELPHDSATELLPPQNTGNATSIRSVRALCPCGIIYSSPDVGAEQKPAIHSSPRGRLCKEAGQTAKGE